ncbi:MAG: response regulator [Clostridia bacterium]|nr:response regulator [Clostridia bacterium]
MQRILIVDDDGINLKMASNILKSSYKIIGVPSGEKAIEYLTRDIPDLILLDVHMPDMDGFKVMEYIQSKDEYKDIPVIFLTADNDIETEVKGFKAGALDFIIKPFVAEIMLQRVGRILELSTLQKHLQKEIDEQTKKAIEKHKMFERLSLQIMQTLACTIDVKDKYTNGHSLRVAKYARMIAQRAGKSFKEQEEIYYMGLLHDIGKIGVPDDIINKTSSLTDEEYDIIKTHPEMGSEILKNITEIASIMDGARWHHERYDGTGYPDGLKGEDIPEVARIIGVADAYDAMTSNRSYRNAFSQEKVKEELKKGKVAQFDPKFADIMLEIMDEDIEYDLREKL